MAVVAAEEILRHGRLRVNSPSEVAVARRTLPRPAEACTTRQPAVVCHTVHSREIDKPLPQLAVAPAPALSVTRSTPLRRRHIPGVLSSDSRATQTIDVKTFLRFLKVRGRDIYISPLTGKPRPAAVYNARGVVTGNDTSWHSARSGSPLPK